MNNSIKNDIIAYIENILSMREQRLAELLNSSIPISKAKDFRKKIRQLKLFVIDISDDDALEQIENNLKEIIRLIGVAIQSQSSNQEEFKTFSGNLTEQVKWFLKLWERVNTYWIEYQINELQEDASSTVKDFNKYIEAFNTEIGSFRDLSASVQSEYETIKSKYDPVIAQAEILLNTANFLNKADKLKQESNKWLIASGIALALLIAALVMLCDPCNWGFLKLDLHFLDRYAHFGASTLSKLTNYEIAKNIGVRLLYVSIASFMLGFTLKSYNNTKHNETIYFQKAGSLAAALQLLDRASTNEGKDNLLIQASTAIFSHQPTGYNSKDPENISVGILDSVKPLLAKPEK